MNKPHVHAELIKAWADDPSLVLQCRRGAAPNPAWIDLEYAPSWHVDLQYRIKPELVIQKWYVGPGKYFTFDEGKLVAAEVL